jgi:hypothetical protein
MVHVEGLFSCGSSGAFNGVPSAPIVLHLTCIPVRRSFISVVSKAPLPAAVRR